MSTEPVPNSLVMGLWARVQKQPFLFAVFLDDAMPFVEDPELIPQEGYLPESIVESLLMTFVTLEGAQAYMNFLPDIHDDKRPSQFTVKRIYTSDLMQMIPELNQMSEGEFGCSVRIDVADQLNADTLISDTLYSKYLEKN